MSLQIFTKIWNVPNEILRCLRETDSWKNLKSKILWHCPFKFVRPAHVTVHRALHIHTLVQYYIQLYIYIWVFFYFILHSNNKFIALTTFMYHHASQDPPSRIEIYLFFLLGLIPTNLIFCHGQANKGLSYILYTSGLVARRERRHA